MTKIKLIKEAARHQAMVLYYLEQSHEDVKRGKRNMAFWCLEMAANHRRHYTTTRSAITNV
jgi:hypothetical protein